MTNSAVDAIKAFESYRSVAYWDVNAWRVGYGSDTVTTEDGKVMKVTKGTVTTRAAADRDIARRVPQYQAGIIKTVGQEAWDKLSDDAKAAVTSTAYNYGSISGLGSLKKAIKSGDPALISKAILNRSVDNGGINLERRTKEAAMVAGHPIPMAGIADDPKGGAAGVAAAAGSKAGAAAVPPPLPRARPEPAGMSPLPAPSPLVAPKAGVGGLEANGAAVAGNVPASGAGGLAARRAAYDAQVARGWALGSGTGVKGSASLTATTRRAEDDPMRSAMPAAPAKPAVAVPVVAKNTSGSPDDRNAHAVSKATTVTVAPSGETRTTAQAGTVAMPPGARPASVPAVMTGGRSPTERDEAKAPVYKTISVLNPAYKAPAVQTGGLSPTERDEANAGMRLAGGVGSGVTAPKYITKRVLVTPAKVTPTAAPAVKSTVLTSAPAAAAPSKTEAQRQQQQADMQSMLTAKGFPGSGRY